MSDPGSPARRPGVARPFIATLLGVGVVAGGTWVAARHMGGAAPDAPPPVTPAALSRAQPTPMPTAQQAVANSGNAPRLLLDGPASAGATGGGPSAAATDKAAPAPGELGTRAPRQRGRRQARTRRVSVAWRRYGGRHSTQGCGRGKR